MKEEDVTKIVYTEKGDQIGYCIASNKFYKKDSDYPIPKDGIGKVWVIIDGEATLVDVDTFEKIANYINLIS